MTSRTIVAAGRQIEARYIPGRTDRPVLVFLHEGLGSVELWKQFPDELAQGTGCAALIYSRYGNGFSEVLHEARPVSYMHDEARSALPDVLDAFDVHDAVLVGHSDGASIALIYAGESGERVRAVVAEAPHVFVEDISISSIARAKFAYESSDLRERMERYHQNVDRTFYGWNDVWLDPEFRAWNIRDAVRRISIPMLLIQGAQDEYGTSAQLDVIQADVQSARVDSLYLADCRHAPHRDRPDVTLSAVRTFVDAISERLE